MALSLRNLARPAPHPLVSNGGVELRTIVHGERSRRMWGREGLIGFGSDQSLPLRYPEHRAGSCRPETDETRERSGTGVSRALHPSSVGDFPALALQLPHPEGTMASSWSAQARALHHRSVRAPLCAVTASFGPSTQGTSVLGHLTPPATPKSRTITSTQGTSTDSQIDASVGIPRNL